MRRATLAAAFWAALILAGSALAQETSAEEAVEATGLAEPVVADAAAATALPAIADFIQEPLIGEVAVAPGGRHVAFVQRANGISYLVVHEPGAPETRPVMSRLGEVRVYGLKWISDERLVYSAGANKISLDYKRGQLVFNGAPRLYASNRDLKDTLVFFKDDKRIESANSIATSEINRIAGDTENFVVPLRVGRRLDLVRVNARDGSWARVADGSDRTISWFVDASGRPAMRFDANRRFTRIHVMVPRYRQSGFIDWREAFSVRVDSLSARSAEFSPIGPGPQPGYFYVIGRPPGADRAGVHLYHLESQRFTSEVFTHPMVDVHSGLVDARTGAFIGATYWDDTLGATFMEGRLQNHFDGLKEFFGAESSVVIVDASADQRTWLLLTHGPRDPGTYHVYDMATMHSEAIGAVSAQLTRARLGEAEPIAYKARDGLDIRGYLTMPPNLAEGAKPPLIVMPHGGPEARDMMVYDEVVQFLATRGYAVFQPNFRGSAGYGKAFVDAGNRQFGGAMQTDVTDGVQLLVDEGRVDGSRMCIFGESYGGYVALIATVRTPDLFRCAASAAGISDLNLMLRREREGEGADSEAYKYWVTKIGDPQRDKAAIEAASPLQNINAIRTPILLLHGTADSIVAYEQSDLMHTALKKASKRSKIIVFQNTGHSLRGPNLETYLTHLEAFFAEHIGSPVTH